MPDSTSKNRMNPSQTRNANAGEALPKKREVVMHVNSANEREEKHGSGKHNGHAISAEPSTSTHHYATKEKSVDKKWGKTQTSDMVAMVRRGLREFGRGLATLILAGVALQPLVAQGQTLERVAVSNLNQPGGVTSITVERSAIRFRTGNHPSGYPFYGVWIRILSVPSGVTAEISIRSNSGGRPGGTVHNLSGRLAAGTRFFSASSGARLEANQSYHVHIEKTDAGGDFPSLVTTLEDGEDDTKLEGWSIDNQHQHRSGTNWLASTVVFRIAVIAGSYFAPEFIPAVNDRYDCIMRESPDPGSVVCNSFHNDNPGVEGPTTGIHASAWAYSATDADGDTLTYSLEGPDADDFNINSANGNVTTKKEGSRYNNDRNGGKKVFRVTLKATDPSGLTGTQAAIVTFEDAFEITSLNVNTWIRNGYVVNPRANVRWDNPWSGGHSTKLKDFEIQYYDTTSPDNYNRESGIGKSKRYFELKYSLQFDKEYMVRVVATGESRGGLHNVHTDSLDETPWRRFSTGPMPGASGAPGDPLTAAFINAPASHDGSTAFMMQLEFNATLTTGWEALRDSITVTNGTLTRINRVSSLSHLWNLEITPTSESFITIAVAPSGVCDGDNGICAGGRLLEEGVTTKIYGTRAVTTVTNAEISNGPGDNGTWDTGETVDVEVTFSSAVTIGGATIGKNTLDGVRRDAAFEAYIGDTGGRFSYPVTAADAGATQALLVSNSLDASNGIIGDSGGGDVILDFDGDVAETVEPEEEQEPSADALTAQFQNLPDEHEGNEDTFSVQILFDAALSGSWTNVRDAITVTNGTHTGTSRVDGRNDLWRIGVEATSDADVTVHLRASVACGQAGALCTSDSRRFETAISTVIDGPDVDEVVEEEEPATPLTASLSGMPYSHDGQSAFKFRMRFSEALAGHSYRTMRDSSVVAIQGTTSIGASNASRVNGSNAHWEITITPRTHEAIAISFVTPTDCEATGAMCSASGAALSSVLSATVKGPPGMTIADATVAEATGAMLHFDITLEHGPSRNVTVDYATSDGSAIAGSDYTAKSGTIVVGAGETLKRISVKVLNDNTDEDSENMTLTLSNPSTGVLLSNTTATGTITNSDPMPKAWLTRFGRTVASQAVDAIGARMDGDARSHLQVGGMSLNREGKVVEDEKGLRKTGIEELDWRDRNRDAGSMTATDLLLGSAFQLSTGGENGAPTWTAWGNFSMSGFEAEVNDVTMNGDVTSGFLGADISRDQWLGGLALSMSRGDGDFSLVDEGGTGEVESTLTAIYPYAKVGVTEKVDVWGMVGLGTGDVTVTDTRPQDQPVKTDISMRMGAIGARGELLSANEAGGMSLAIKTDAFVVQMESDAVHGGVENMVATKSDASRVRLALEGSRAFEVGAGTLIPRAEIGIRQDGGDAETGTGVEIGGGISYQGAGFSIEGSVRKLVAHEESGYDEWGASGSVRIDPGASGRGLSLTLTPTFGAASSGVEQLWTHRDATGLTPDGEFEAESQFETELGYGIGLRGNHGLLTPYTGLSLREGGDRTWRTGTRWKMAEQATLGLEATRSEAQNAPAMNALIVRSVVRW